MSDLPVSNPLREAIRRHDVPIAALAREAGIEQASLSRFCAGKSGLRLESIDRLASLLGMQLQEVSEPTVLNISARDERGSTEVGVVNLNDQQVVKRTNRQGSHRYAKLVRMRCRRCRTEYYCNSCDCHERRCPNCQGGAPSSE